MAVSWALSRISNIGSAQSRVFWPSSRQITVRSFSSLYNSITDRNSSSVFLIPHKANQLLRSTNTSTTCVWRFWFSTSAAQPSVKESNKSDQHKDEASKKVANAKSSKGSVESSTESDDSDREDELSMEDLATIVSEKEELLKSKHKEIETLQEKVLRAYAEMENVMDRTKRDAENSKKFAVQNFAKNLLDVADNLERACSVVKESLSKDDLSKESAKAMQLLKTLLDGVEMTEKQLQEVFRKFGIEKFNPENQAFDPNGHHAVFKVPDPSKPAGSVAAVLKPGYTIHDRILRPAEVGVTVTPSEDAEPTS